MPVHVPEHLEDLARRIRAAGAPTDFLESNIVEHVSRELGRKHAVEHAAALVDALNETPGAPRAKLWTKADRADVRVYFAGDLGYVTIGWDGSIGGAAAVPGRRSQSLTFSPDSLYPSQRRAYRAALNTYREGLIERLEEHTQERVEKIAELRVALGVDAEDVDDEALERAAERAAWQDAHEGGWGRQNPEADYEAIERAVLRAANQNRRNPDGGGFDADEAFAALDHSDKVREKLYAHRDQFGTRRGVRLDIPSAKRGIVVVSVHEGPSGGTVIGYDRGAVVDDARFIVQAGGQKQIGAEGSNKFPMSYVGGTLVGEEATPAGVPVYYDPRHVHLYVDARNGMPLKGAGRVNFSAQRGEDYFLPEIRTIYVWAEDPVYYAPGEAPEPPDGMESAVAMPRGKPRHRRTAR